MGIGGCFFCIEFVRYCRVEDRLVEDVVVEVKVFYIFGVRYFWVGRQSCIFFYMVKLDGRVFILNFEVVEKFFCGICLVVLNVKMFYVDNVNFVVIVNYFDESRRIVKVLIEYGIFGDVVVFGLESVDLKVVKFNNFNVIVEEIYEVVKFFNEIGGRRGYNGMLWFFLGINIIFGLLGEIKKSYEIMFQFLKRFLDDGLMVRCINICQVVVFLGIFLWYMRDKVKVEKYKKFIQYYCYKIRYEIDLFMFRCVVLVGIVLRDVCVEVFDNGLIYGRQIGSYLFIVGMFKQVFFNKFYDVLIVDYGFRSIIGIFVLINVNEESLRVLEYILGIGKKIVVKILVKCFFKILEEFFEVIGEDKKNVLKDLIILQR